jgi:hypothetical protein
MLCSRVNQPENVAAAQAKVAELVIIKVPPGVPFSADASAVS